MTNRIGFLASAALHSALAVTAVTYLADGPRSQPQERRITMSLEMFQPPPERTHAMAELAPIPAALEPLEKMDEIPEPVEEVVEENPFAEEVEPRLAETTPEPARAVESHHHTPPVVAAGPSYISQVAAVVEKNKFYPMAARRRGLEGEAKITLNINEDGSLQDLKVECGHPMLAKAAEDAVLASCPLPRPGDSAQCPMCLVFLMKFKLD